MPSYPSRCQHIKVNGTQCGSPALRRNRFCYFHKLHHDERVELNAARQKNARARRRKVAIDLPVLEDANSIQVSLMQITRLLITGELDTKTAGLVLYALQTASSNLHRTDFNPHMRDVILDPARVAETALGAQIWEDSDFIDEDDIEEEDDGVDPARRAGIMKAAEFLYDLDKRDGGIHGFAPKPVPSSASNPKPGASAAAPKTPPNPKAPDPTAKKSPARELSTEEVRNQVRQEIVNAAPALLAANRSLIPRLRKDSQDVPT